MLQRRRQISVNILILIFAFYYANISFFYHSHIINGFTISHSHFHDSEHPKTGTHSEKELSLITVLSVFQSLQASLCVAGMELFLLSVTIFRMGSEQKPAYEIPCYSYLRAPPSLF